MKIALILAAGGQGRRFGRNKQLFLHKNKPLFIHTIEKFQKQKIGQLIIAAGEAKKFQRLLEKYKIKGAAVVAGGVERCDSIRHGLAALRGDITHVFIHDGARPNVTDSLVARLKKALRKHAAVIPVIPVADTIKVVKNNKILATPRRAELFAAQTPQCFRKDIILKAYAKINPQNCTDDAMLVEKLGLPVYTVPGEADNIKITTREDLKYIV
ncbi:2-C-methyl-D-erythritol 4-phosphate cytidylyltransferase [Candidatus Termititenax aidoneus]|uniref:2-C-methyl-D-erythritol 4-phosphate cytidylyltransferase n=1 Tax=Termititenax aidoneus TaxID=2218524 RepID=A0A388TDW0_TERA1|nr:2-C-methyl-D-erythritol 4-phosphate cytidylyltransferase [Candidatus Termititenax aidoneus]